MASRLGKVGEIVPKIIIGLLGMAWSIMTIFVVPVLVYEDLSPVDAIKKSIAVIKKTWGESLIRVIGLGLTQLFVFAAIIAGCVALCYSLYALFDGMGIVIGIGIGIGSLLLAGLIFAVANTVYNTALYVYANSGTVASGFSEEIVKGGFRLKE